MLKLKKVMKNYNHEQVVSNKKLIQRFVKDYNLPINIFEPGMFFYYRDLYSDDGIFPIVVWNRLVDTIISKYNGDVESWLNYCAKVRDNAIFTIHSSNEFNNFNNVDLKPYVHTHSIGEHSCYTNETDGNFFLSIDLRKANFQALKYMNVINDESYVNFIKRFGGDDYIADSKYLRQVIFGKCNPSRTITIEKHLINNVFEYVVNKRPCWFDNRFTLFSMNADEIVFKFNSDQCKDVSDKCRDLELAISTELDIEVKVDLFRVEKLPITNSNGDNIDAYVKHSYSDGTKKLKKVSTTFFPQIYKLWKGKIIKEIDKKFWFENQIATFDKSLILNY